MENLSLKERIAAMQEQETHSKIKTEQTKQQTTQELVTEIADSIEGHLRLEEKMKKLSAGGQEVGGGYTADIYREENKIFTERASVERNAKELESNKIDIAKLEEQLGADAVTDLKAQLQEDESSLREQQQKLAESEKKLVAFAKQQRGFNSQAGNRAETPTGEGKDIATFATESVMKSHKETKGQDYGARGEELKGLAQQEVGRRTAKEQKKEIEKQADLGVRNALDKIGEQERLIREAQSALPELTKQRDSLFASLDQVVADLRKKTAQLNAEFEKDKGFFQSKKSKQNRESEIQQELTKMEKQFSSSEGFYKLLGLRNGYHQYESLANFPPKGTRIDIPNGSSETKIAETRLHEAKGNGVMWAGIYKKEFREQANKKTDSILEEMRVLFKHGLR